MATFKSGTVIVTSAGTKVAFPSANRPCVWIQVTAAEGNTGNVFFGDSTVSVSAGRTLHPGTDGVHSQTEIPFYHTGSVQLDSLYLDAANNGDKAYFEAVLE